MLYTVPDYYKKFECLAGECPATCCAGWQIVIDQKSLRKYASLKGSFGNRVRNSVNWKEQTFRQYGKRCAFLNEDNLCDMHIEAGADMMCATCRKYPRHIEVFENEREVSLSMSCPAAAKLILGQKNPADFRYAEDAKEDLEDENFDSFLYSALQDTRKLLFEIMQNREESVFLRMAKVLALAHDVQNRIDGGRIFEIEEVLISYRKEGVQKKLQKKILREAEDFGQNGPAAGNLGQNNPDGRTVLNLLREFEVLDQIWQPEVQNCKNILAAAAKDERGRKEIQEFFTDNVIPETEYEQMMVYYLYTYFCGSVYDGAALAKVKMAAAGTLIWAWLCCAHWLEQKKKLSFTERLQLAWRYSRELEHSDQNLNKMDELSETHTELEFHRLMKCLAVFANEEVKKFDKK